jgi:hypothetical protein
MKNLWVDFFAWESEGTVWWILVVFILFFVFSSFLPLVLFLVLFLIRSLITNNIDVEG